MKCRTAGHAKGHLGGGGTAGAVENRDVENGGNDWAFPTGKGRDNLMSDVS